MTLPSAGTPCRAIIKSGCTKGCRGQGQCFKANLRSTVLAKAIDFLGGRHHYNVIKLMVEVTLTVLQNI